MAERNVKFVVLARILGSTEYRAGGMEKVATATPPASRQAGATRAQ
jgi:hypothetical protein